MPVDRAAIAKLIPHSGPMCLLDEVTEWDAVSVKARSGTHRDAANPLRIEGRIPTLCAIEYAAQAMAIHGGLSGAVTARPRAGYLVSLRNVICATPFLDEHEGDVNVEARQLAADDERVQYSFTLRVGQIEVLQGSATVMLDVSEAASPEAAA